MNYMTPKRIQLKQQSQTLVIEYEGEEFTFTAEFLRVHSPSAEVKGHGPGQEVLQYGKKNVLISQLERAGNYGLKIHFDDGHNSGIYTWDYFYELGKNQENLWQAYLQKLHNAGQSRERDTQIVKFMN
jgi:DUF971 family protein